MSAPDGSSVETRKLDHALVGGFAWTAGAKWLSQLVAWPAVLITAKLLSPGDYGLTEMAGFYFVVTNVMAEFGIGMAVLQMRELDMGVTAQLNTVAAMSGVVAFLASIAAAPLIAAFFHAPELHELVIVASFSFILTSIEAIPLGLLQRDMNYRLLSVAESVQAVVTSCISVGCAYGGLGYWSLVLGNMCGRAANIALVVYSRPVRFAWPHLGQVLAPLRFGMEIAVQRVVGSINGLSDSMVIGRTMGRVPVGAYRFAANLASTPSEKIGAGNAGYRSSFLQGAGRQGTDGAIFSDFHRIARDDHIPPAFRISDRRPGSRGTSAGPEMGRSRCAAALAGNLHDGPDHAGPDDSTSVDASPYPIWHVDVASYVRSYARGILCCVTPRRGRSCACVAVDVARHGAADRLEGVSCDRVQRRQLFKRAAAGSCRLRRDAGGCRCAAGAVASPRVDRARRRSGGGRTYILHLSLGVLS